MHQNFKETIRDALKPRTLALFFLGFSAGLPFMLIFSTLSFWLREAGIERSQITMLSWVGLLFGFKWIWAPLVDNLKLPYLGKKLGKRRSWLLFAQLIILASLIGLGFQSPMVGLSGFIVFALLLALGTATQDICIDAYRIECAPDDEQGILAASYQGGYRTAMLVGGAGALEIAAALSPDPQIYDLVAWQHTYHIIAGVSLVGMLTTVMIPEPYRPHPTQTFTNIKDWLRHSVVDPFTDFVKRFGKMALLILGVIAIYRISDIVMGVIANPFYVDMGFSKTEISRVIKTFGFAMTLTGAAAGGVLISRFGITKILYAGAILAAASNLCFALLAQSGHSVPGLIAVIIVDNLSGGIATASFIAFLSSLTNTTFSATQYALFSSLMAILPKFVAGFSGTFVDKWGYTSFFVFTALLGIPTLILLSIYMKHQPQKESHIPPYVD